MEKLLRSATFKRASVTERERMMVEVERKMPKPRVGMKVYWWWLGSAIPELKSSRVLRLWDDGREVEMADGTWMPSRFLVDRNGKS